MLGRYWYRQEVEQEATQILVILCNSNPDVEPVAITTEKDERVMGSN